MEDRLKKIEERIEKLENPLSFSNKFIESLTKEGFLKYEKELLFTSPANIPYIIMFIKYGNSKSVITADPVSIYTPFSVDLSSDEIIAPMHGFSDGMQVFLMSTGNLPSPLDNATFYWVMSSTTNTFKVSIDNITPVNITDMGIGQHYARFAT